MEFRVYNHLDYREIIINLCKIRGISNKSLASSAHIHTSYFSRVMGGNADFSGDQLYLIGRDLSLDNEELQFFLMLGEHGRSGNVSHKNYVHSKIEAIQKEKLKIKNTSKYEFNEKLDSIRTQEFYTESTTAKILMLLTIKKYCDNPLLIAKRIFISENKLKRELEKLEKMQLIEIGNPKIIVIKPFVQLEPFSPMAQINDLNWRQESIFKISRRDENPTDYHFSATFSSNEEVKVKARDLFKEFVNDVQNFARDQKGAIDDVYHIGFDLYGV
ncbi:MAG: DUF4423 domain-containing protein [Bacteriovoracaceae bacterium]|jgi:hypothetical protein|nr:DUF4423 domain-containing protein [Bacteriovoracaceae bacterium]